MAVVLLALPALALGHAPIGMNGERFHGDGRRLWNEQAKESHIWGVCEEWDSNVTGCELFSYKCNAYNSPGPDTYDMEITLGNLTPSTPENPVHLAWWAPRKSQTAWNPHLNLEGCAVYRHMNSAYPKYSDVDFNGGNLQVDSNGQITIRFQAPATYYVTSWISVPHVHLRLCSNDTFAHTTQDAIVFIADGPELVAGEAGSHLQILDYKNFTYAEKTGGPLRSVSDRDIIGVLTWRTTTPTTSSPFIDELVNNTDWDGLDNDFPIVQCFSEGKLFDQLTGACTWKCSESKEVADFQCVRPANYTMQEAVATWSMQAQCSEVCCTESKDKALFSTRLALADLLDVPFQEVERVAITFHGANWTQTSRAASVQVYIKTQRLTMDDVNAMLSVFLPTPSVATAVMHFPVDSVALTRLANDGEWQPVMETCVTSTTDNVDNSADPYEDASNGDLGGNSSGGIPSADLSVGVMIAVAVAVLQ